MGQPCEFQVAAAGAAPRRAARRPGGLRGPAVGGAGVHGPPFILFGVSLLQYTGRGHEHAANTSGYSRSDTRCGPRFCTATSRRSEPLTPTVAGCRGQGEWGRGLRAGSLEPPSWPLLAHPDTMHIIMGYAKYLFTLWGDTSGVRLAQICKLAHAFM
jgi:hypothetical protein